MSAETKKIVLKSSDEEIFEVEEAVAVKSVTINHMIEDSYGADDVIPLPNVTAQILSRVLEYCKQHLEIGGDKEKKEELKKWDAEFIESVDMDTLYDLIQASNFLYIQGLLDLCCETVGNMINGKKPEQIREIFGIKNDFTAEEEAAIKKENIWALDE